MDSFRNIKGSENMSKKKSHTQILGDFGLGRQTFFVPFIQGERLRAFPTVLDYESWELLARFSFMLIQSTYGSIKIQDGISVRCALGTFLVFNHECGGTFVDKEEGHHMNYFIDNRLSGLLRTSHSNHAALQACCANEEEFRTTLAQSWGITHVELQRLLHGLEVIAGYCEKMRIRRLEFSDDLDIVHTDVEEYGDLAEYIVRSELRVRRKKRA